jgi:hypothetical protein
MQFASWLKVFKATQVCLGTYQEIDRALRRGPLRTSRFILVTIIMFPLEFAKFIQEITNSVFSGSAVCLTSSKAASDACSSAAD